MSSDEQPPKSGKVWRPPADSPRITRPDQIPGTVKETRVWRPPDNQPAGARSRIPPAVRLVAGLALLVILGTSALLLPGVGTTRPLTLQEALFTATSALTVTGLSVIVPGRDLTALGQAILMLLVQAGGVGFMVLAVVAFRVIGRRLSIIDRLTLRDSLDLSSVNGVVKLTGRVLRAVVLIELIGALLLWWVWREQLGDRRALWYGMFHAVTAFCNAGFDLFGASDLPGVLPNDGTSLAVLGTLIVLGGLGIPVIADLIAFPRTRSLSFQARLTLWVTALLIVFGMVGFWAVERAGGVLINFSLWRQLELALFQSVSARTAGFAAVPGFEQQKPATQLLTMGLMFIGCAPASMGGGITTSAFAVLGLGLWSYARGLPQPVLWGRSLTQDAVRRAGAVLTISVGVIIAATWLILLTHNATLDQALFEVVSAFATTGLTLAFTSQLNLVGQIIIILVMFWGRLGALTVIVALANPPGAPRVSYPEEQLLIG